MTISTKQEDALITRKQAAKILGVTSDSVAVFDSIKRYDLKPEKKDGRVYYRVSVVNAVQNLRLAKRKKKKRYPL